MPRSHSDSEIINSKITYLTKDGEPREAVLGHNTSSHETTGMMSVKSSSISDLRSKPAYAVAKHYAKEPADRIIVSELLAHNFFKCKTAKTSQGTTIFLMDKFPGIDGLDFLDLIYPKPPENEYTDSESSGDESYSQVEDNIDIEQITHKLKMLFQAILSAMYNLVLIKEKNIIHNDIKLDNIMMFPIYNPKTNDFEISAAVIDFGHAYQLNSADEIISFDGRFGTPGYQAPEIYDGKASLQSDLFSFGLFLCDLLDSDHRIVDPDIQVDDSDGSWFYRSQLKHQDVKKLYCFDDLPGLQEKQAYQQLIDIINQTLSSAPSQRGDITEHFKTCKTIYSELFDGAIFEPSFVPKKEQTKFDKLMKTATRLAGMIERGNMFSKNPDDDIAMLSRLFVHQIHSYSQDDKIESLITDNKLCYHHKRHLFKAIAQLSENSPKHITHRRNITDVIKILHVIQTSESQSTLQEGFNNIADKIKSEHLKNILQNWQQESFPNFTSAGPKP